MPTYLVLHNPMQPQTSTTYLKQGQQLQRQGLLTEAEVAYRQAIELNPIFYGSFRYLGEVLALEGKLDQAVEAYQRAKELNPKALWVHQGLGEVFLQLSKIDDAIACFQTAIEVNPDFSWAYNGLGDCWSLKGNRENAIAAYQKAVELNPDSESFRQNLDQVLAQHNQVFKEEITEPIDDSTQANVYFELGQNQEQEGQLEDAITSYLESVKLSPETFDYCHRLGEVLASLNQPLLIEKAISMYEAIITETPDSSQAYRFLGDLFKHLQQWEKSQQAYFRSLELCPDAEVYYNLGEVLEKVDQLENALSSYRQAFAFIGK